MTTQGPYEVGALVNLQGLFSDPTSATPPIDPETGFTLVNPSAVECFITKPDGSTLKPTVAATGFVYTAQVIPDRPGPWWYRFDSPTGAYQGARQGFFQVLERRA